MGANTLQVGKRRLQLSQASIQCMVFPTLFWCEAMHVRQDGEIMGRRQAPVTEGRRSS